MAQRLESGLYCLDTTDHVLKPVHFSERRRESKDNYQIVKLKKVKVDIQSRLETGLLWLVVV